MKNEIITPKVNKIYENRNGFLYRCVEVLEDCAVFVCVTSGWTMRVHNVRLYDNGKINWDWSEGGHFVRV